MIRGKQSGTLASVAGLTFALMLASGGASADEPYRLLTGDVVAMSVSGVPDLTQNAEVQLDGSLSLPMVGEVPAAGRTLSDVRESIRTAIASRLVPVYTSDGQEHLRAVSRDQVSAWIAAYRPIFVSGDVARSGEFKYRPGLTVLQAIAAAGGVAATPVTSPIANTAGLEADYRGGWYALAAAEARVWRLHAELGEDVAFDSSILPPSPQKAGALDDILRVEKELRQARDLDNQRQRAFLERSIQQISEQTTVLKNQLEVQSKSEVADAADLAKAVGATGKGIYTESRMSDLRRAALTSATMRLQTESNLMLLERRSTEISRDLERLDDNRHLALLDELQQAEVDRAAAEAKLGAIVSRLQAAGIAVPAAGADGKIALTVVRAGVAKPIVAAPDLELQPGDVIQVSRSTATEAPAVGATAPDGASRLSGQTSQDTSRLLAAGRG